MATLLERIPKAVVGWIALLGTLGTIATGSFALGAATRETVAGHRELPARVGALERNDARQDTTLAYLMRVDSLRPPVWATVERIDDALAEMQCILQAQAKNESATGCLKTFGGPQR